MRKTTATAVKARSPLTRDRIVDAALSVMDTEGLEAVSMRRVAREVGVEAMSLYNHVEDKEDLLQAVCDRIMVAFEFPVETEDWVETCKAAARSWRKVLRAHPDVMRLFAETHGPSPSSPESLKPTEFALRLLRSGGLSDRDTVQAFHVFGGYIQGFVMMESGSIQKSQGSDGAFEVPGSELPADVFPVLHAVHRYFADCPADEQFEFGLDLLLRGLRDRVADGA
jgi:TetR/AcrR family tetracycline transcriptional repressor